MPRKRRSLRLGKSWHYMTYCWKIMNLWNPMNQREKLPTLCDTSLLASKIWPEPQYYSLVLLKDASMAKLYSCFKDSIVFNLARWMTPIREWLSNKGPVQSATGIASSKTLGNSCRNNSINHPRQMETASNGSSKRNWTKHNIIAMRQRRRNDTVWTHGWREQALSRV